MSELMDITDKDLEGYAELTDPADPWPAELVGQLARALLSASTRLATVDAVVKAAREWTANKCIPDDANCDAGDHDDCGLREKRAALWGAIDALDAQGGGER